MQYKQPLVRLAGFLIPGHIPSNKLMTPEVSKVNK